MANAKKATKATKANKAPAKSATTVQETTIEQPSNVISLPSVAGSPPPNEPPQSKLHAKVIIIMAEGKAWQDKLHPLAIECLEHAKEHGDLRPLLVMQNEMPKSARKVAFAAWALTFAPIIWGKRDAQDCCNGIKLAKEGDKGFKPWNIEEAKLSPFFEAKEKPPAPTAFLDIIKQLEQDNKRIEKCLADPAIVRKNGETDEQLKAKQVSNMEDIAYFMRKKVA